MQSLVGVGERAERNARALRGDIPEVAAAFLAAQPQVMTSSIDSDGRVWASLLSGPPGFTRASHERQVVIAAAPLPGDPLDALADGDRMGVLGVEPESRRRMRVSGHARRRDDGGFVLDTDQVVSNCQRYISRRQHHWADEAGEPARGPVGVRLTPGQQAWIAATDTFFIATAAEDGADISHRGGNPGFVHVLDDRHLSWPDYSGNAMFLTLGHLHLNPHAGLLLIEWEHGSTLQLTGTAHVDFEVDADTASRYPGAERMVHFELDQVSEVTSATDLRWELEERSPANPPVSGTPSGAPRDGQPREQGAPQ